MMIYTYIYIYMYDNIYIYVYIYIYIFKHIHNINEFIYIASCASHHMSRTVGLRSSHIGQRCLLAPAQENVVRPIPIANGPLIQNIFRCQRCHGCH